MAKRRLTKQQKTRIAKIQQKRLDKALDQSDNAPTDDLDISVTHDGTVITRHGNHIVVENSEGKLIHCLLRQNIGHIVCGDKVLWAPSDNDDGVVVAIKPRQTVLSRPTWDGTDKPLAANISQIIIVVAPQPEPSPYLIDQYLVTAENMGASPVIVINKADLLERPEYGSLHERLRQQYETIGYPVLKLSAKHNQGLTQLIHRLGHHTNILLGQSGVGKSSLVNAFIPDLELQTNRLSEKTNLGKHTTTASTLYRLPENGSLIDSPGVRSFRLSKPNRQLIEKGYIDMQPFISQCKFSDCSHTHEPGCALLIAKEKNEIHPQRLDNFVHMLQQLKNTN